jgi:hypothetical protein
MLEIISASPGFTAALLLTGLALGLLIARLVLPGPKRVRELEDQLEKAHKEHQAYRGCVTTHFRTTAELVGKMTDSYKAVYDHLAHGSQTLCGDYDALTSSVFGSPRIIHDPKVAVGDTTIASEAADVESPVGVRSTTDVPLTSEASDAVSESVGAATPSPAGNESPAA